MDFSQNEVSPVRRFGGLGIVILVHIIGGYLLISGLATRMIDTIKKPVETKVIKDQTPPPPPPPDPTPPPPKVAAPPPPFIPPPEVQVTTKVESPIATQTTVKPAEAPVKAMPPAPPAPAGPVPGQPPRPSFADLNACKPEYPRASIMAEEQGTVRVQFEVSPDGQLIGANIAQSSGYKNLDRATVNALSRCKFQPAWKDGHPVQSSFAADYVWKLPD